MEYIMYTKRIKNILSISTHTLSDLSGVIRWKEKDIIVRWKEKEIIVLSEFQLNVLCIHNI